MASLLLGAAPFLNFSSFSSISSSQSQTLGTSLSVSTSSLSLPTSSSPSVSHVYCGRGDKKQREGSALTIPLAITKLNRQDLGTRRRGGGPPRVPVPPSPPRKDKFDDIGEKIKIEIDESLFSS